MTALADAAVAVWRRAILAAADNGTLHRLVSRHGLRLGARRFVAGETFAEAVPTLRRLNDQGLLTNTTLLGEAVHEPAETRAIVTEYERVLDGIRGERLRTKIAVKPTHVGLALDPDLAYENVSVLAGHAQRLDIVVRLDMEQSRYVDATLDLYRRLRGAGIDNVGVVLQAYLYRSERDLEELLPLGLNVRLCKGAYLEPSEIAYRDRHAVDASFVRLLDRALREARFVAVATHDERLIEHTIAFVEREGIPAERFQFQLLYGVRTQLQRSLARRGHAVLVATPYGPDWYRYFMRRLAERPANLGFLLRNLVRG